MTEKELVEVIALDCQRSRALVKEVLESFKSNTSLILAEGEKVVLKGFGVFTQTTFKKKSLFGKPFKPGSVTRIKFTQSREPRNGKARSSNRR